MKLCLHIGQPKAASSSIQRALWDRRSELAAGGVLYPNTPSKNHNNAVADFLLQGSASGGSRFRQELIHLGVPGLWKQLADDARAARQVIVSSEFLINLTLPWIHRWMDGFSSGHTTILLCVRRASESLPSSYAQEAKTAPTINFDPWLRCHLRFGDGKLLYPLDVSKLQAIWSQVGDLRLVEFNPLRIAAFQEQVMSALSIELERPWLGHYNPSPSAAMVEAWQSLLRIGRPVDPRLLRTVRDVGCGRYALQPDVAALVDAAYPMAGEADSAARVELQARILHPEPMTTISVSDAEWQQGLRRCQAQLEAGLA
jgi:hypothetical protein